MNFFIVRGPDGKFQTSPDKVVVARQLAEDEVDVDSGFLMLPNAIPKAETVPTPSGEPEEPTPPVEPVGPCGPEVPIKRIVQLKFKSTRDQLFKAFPAIANLADKSDDGKVTVYIEGKAQEGYDSSWLRNAVNEPLDEADVEIE